MGQEDINLEAALNHPLRRAHSGPSDVEWALLVNKVTSLEEAVKNLTKEVRSFNEYAINRCGTCQNYDSVKDHEKRLREVERLIYKGVGIAIIGATALSIFLNHLFK